jgi:hypothetical protein
LSDGYLSAESERYQIKKWDNSILEFVTETNCVSYVYVVNRSTARLTGRRLKKEPTDDNCKLVLERDLALSFVDGFSVARSLQQQHAPSTYTLPAAVLWTLFIVAWAVRVIRRNRISQ